MVLGSLIPVHTSTLVLVQRTDIKLTQGKHPGHNKGMPEVLDTTETGPETIMDLAGTMSMADLARAAGLSRSHMSLVLRGKRSPSLDTCHRLAQALNQDVAEVIRLLPRTERQQLFLRVHGTQAA